MSAEQWAKGAENLLKEGYKFDFSEFRDVKDGQPLPFMKKLIKRINKFGIKDNYILTARPTEANIAIKEFLKEFGIDIPLKNVLALGNSTGEAKALKIVEGIAKKGYND